MLKNKRRLQERKQLGMVHENDQIDQSQDLELFNLPALRKVSAFCSRLLQTFFFPIVFRKRRKS